MRRFVNIATGWGSFYEQKRVKLSSGSTLTSVYLSDIWEKKLSDPFARVNSARAFSDCLDWVNLAGWAKVFI